MVDEEEWDWIVEHSLRRVRPSRDREHAAGIHAARHPPPRGVERSALRRRWGADGRTPGRARCAARSTSSTGRPSTRLSSDSATGCARSPPAARRRGLPRRFSCSAATSTTPTSREVDLDTASRGSRVFQIVCSPLPKPPRERVSVALSALTGSRAAGALFSRLARLAGVATASARLGARAQPDVRELDRRARARRAALRVSRSGGARAKARASNGSSSSTEPSWRSRPEKRRSRNDRIDTRAVPRTRPAPST